MQCPSHHDAFILEGAVPMQLSIQFHHTKEFFQRMFMYITLHYFTLLSGEEGNIPAFAVNSLVSAPLEKRRPGR
jgi:hypothetical protein